jgi:ABC-type phosphate transport system auxiliary subunit
MWSSIRKNVSLFNLFWISYLKINFRCIEKWLRTSPKCPQCQSSVKKKDLRRIYCRALNVLDTSERDNAIRERDLEKKARRKLAYEKAELQLAYDIIKDQLKRLQNEHDRLLKYTLSCYLKKRFFIF